MERSAVELEDVLAFVRVVEIGSLSRAGDRLGLSKSIVSRRIARLETSLGARLLVRGSRGAVPTQLGADYYARAGAILAELEAASEAVAAATTDVAGPIRVTAPISLAVHLAPALAAFAVAHPRVVLDASFDDRVVDLAAGGFDLGVRIGTLGHSSLVARRLAPVRHALLGSPDYLARAGTLAHPRDLARYDAVVYANAGFDQWRFRDGAAWLTARPRVRLRGDNGDMLVAAAAAGLGLVVLPTFIAASAIAAGTLVTVLPEHPLPDSALWAVMPPGRAATARVRSLVTHLAARFGPEPQWDPCHRASGSVSD